jgi:hypothetical protein
MHQVAQRVINKCGGIRNTAWMIGLSVQSVYKWTIPRAKGGTNGLIPMKRQIELTIAAKKHGIILTPDDFFPKADLPKANNG